MDSDGYEDVIKRYGIGESNQSGERLANPCTFNDMVIGGTNSAQTHT